LDKIYKVIQLQLPLQRICHGIVNLFLIMDEFVQDHIESQEEFDGYINFLPARVNCKFMLSTVVNLCSKPEVKCPFRGSEMYSFAHGPKQECNRPNVLRMREILGTK